MANIALALDHALDDRVRAGTGGATHGRLLASGDGWSVHDVICTCGPDDRPYEERHDGVAIAFVVAGTFQYRARAERALMTPGTIFLGSPGDAFECSHHHGSGDRCVSFRYDPEWFARVASDAGGGAKPSFPVIRVPPMRETSALVAEGAAGALGLAARWEELSVTVAGGVTLLARGAAAAARVPPNAESRIAQAVRRMERGHDLPTSLSALARESGLSPYHFLRTFRRFTGVTPHQFLLRTRLRAAALRLVREAVPVVDVALDAGFGDVSNFNHAFRVEFGMSPRRYRARASGPAAAPRVE